MTKSVKYPRFGEIYLFHASKHSGDSKIRPGVISSKNLVNSLSDRVQVVPISTDLNIQKEFISVRRVFPASATGLDSDSVIMCDKATTILVSRLRSEVIGCLKNGHLRIFKTCMQHSHENGPVLGISLGGA